VRHARRLERPHGFDPNVVGPEAGEERRPAAEEDRRDVELELVDQPCPEGLLDDVGAP
jgi:hypothetical protein